jgi:hypothetical protein
MIGGSTNVRRGNNIATPGDTEHPVTARLDDELVSALLTRSFWDDVFDATIAAIAASNACWVLVESTQG